jgi:hypothetical protein
MYLKVTCLRSAPSRNQYPTLIKYPKKGEIHQKSGENMLNKRTKKRNLLTTNLELTELAYALHVCANRLRTTITEVNIPSSYRIQIGRHVQWMTLQARSLGKELNAPNEFAFTTKESTEKIGEQLGLFS